MNLRISSLFTDSSAENFSLICDSLGIMRSIWSIQLDVAARVGGIAYSAFGAIGSLFIIVNASRLLDASIAEFQEAKSTEMKVIHGALRIPFAASYLSIGLSMLALRTSQIARVALSLAPVFSTVLMSSFLAMSVFKLLESCYGLKVTYELSAMLREKSSQEAMDQLIGLASSEEGSERLIKQTNKNCVEKIKIFARDKGDEKALLDEVKAANYNTNTVYWLLFGVSTVSVIGAGVGLAFTGPATDIVANLLMIVGNVAWVNIDSNSLRKEIVDWFHQHHEKSEKNQYSSKTAFAEFWGKTALGIVTAPVRIIPALTHHVWRNLPSLPVKAAS